MERAQVLEQGQVVLPEVIRRAHHWKIGQELLIIDSDDGVLLTSPPLFEPTTLDEVAGCLQYAGAAKTIDEMHEAIAKGVKQSYQATNCVIHSTPLTVNLLKRGRT